MNNEVPGRLHAANLSEQARWLSDRYADLQRADDPFAVDILRITFDEHPELIGPLLAHLQAMRAPFDPVIAEQVIGWVWRNHPEQSETFWNPLVETEDFRVRELARAAMDLGPRQAGSS